MQIQVNTDNHIEGKEAMTQWASNTIKHELARFTGQITRIEVHLSDENSGKKSTPQDKQCTLEVRLQGLQPVATKHRADNLNQAISGAAEKMAHLLDRALGRKEDAKKVGDTQNASDAE